MDRLIRRHSMERLELYDLDKFENNPPPLPPPRKTFIRRTSMNPSFERYQFLCNMARTKNDPIYAATPMFTTIPQSSQEKSSRQLLGSHIRLENVKPVSTMIPTSPEPKKPEIIEDTEEEDGKENGIKENVDDDYDQLDSGSSSSNDEHEDAADDNDTKGIVQQIFDRDNKT